ncbi:signal peptidase II [bacterium]|nr:signal peptidase II [bacterium]
MKTKYRLLLLVAPLIALIDQLTKYLASTSFRLGETRTVIDGFFNLTHIRNPGAAFGILAQANEVWRLPFFIVVSFLALAVMLYVFGKLAEEQRLQAFSLSLVSGGAIGNLIDRARLGYVVDFLDFHWQAQTHFPSFNMADVAICVGVGGLLLSMRGDAEGQIGMGFRDSTSSK